MEPERWAATNAEASRKVGGAFAKGAGLPDGQGRQPAATRRGRWEGRGPRAGPRWRRSPERGGQGERTLTRFCTVSSGAAASRVRRRRQSGGAGGGEDWFLRAGTPAITEGSFSMVSLRA